MTKKCRGLVNHKDELNAFIVQTLDDLKTEYFNKATPPEPYSITVVNFVNYAKEKLPERINERLRGE
ncbi:MAG: hypothetical protein MUP55_01445 [Candidatus Aenigmarchaeota archaeon]|nr:hypothetical protein [Candidatus Aenigmarchaeota archaeon]